MDPALKDNVIELPIAVEPGAAPSRRWLERAGIVLSLFIFAVAAWAIHHQLAKVEPAQIAAQLRAVQPWQIGLAAVLTILNYVLLSGYDLTALLHVRRKVPLAKVVSTSFVSFAVSNSVGLSFLSGGAVRLRNYTAAGLSAGECATVIALCTMTFGLGSTTIAAGILLIEPGTMLDALGLPETWLRGFALLIMAALCAYLVFVSVKPRILRLKTLTFRLPNLFFTLWQIVFATLDLVVAAAILYLLMPDAAQISFPTLLGAYVLALVAGLVSHVPGGLGVFESTMLILLPQVPTPEMAGTLVLYRAIYYLLPLMIGMVILVGGSAFARLKPAFGVARGIASLAPRMICQVMAVTTFISGAILLFSGATPGVEPRMEILDALVPLSVVEMSHLLGSVLGIMLLILAVGLQHRLDAAWFLTCAGLAAGIVVSLLKGLDWEEASLLALNLACLLPNRSSFYRKARLSSSGPSFGWLTAIIAVVGASIWLGMFAYKHVDYDNYLWWEFALDRGAPRFLRASAVVVIITLVLAFRSLIRPYRPPVALPSAVELTQARRIIATSAVHTESLLALVGDKSFFFNEDKTAFVMFAVRGRNWVAMGEPVGPIEAWPELLWRFREEADRFAARCIFYQLHGEHLPIFVDVGLVPAKIGEEAVVDLNEFALDRPGMKDLRYIRRKLAERDGETFEVIPAAGVPLVIAELRAVSDYWLADKRAREKSFSIGRFDPAYLAETPVAIVRRAGAVVAFANLWTTPAFGEASVDLMRFGPDALPGTMDYLFIELLLWAKAQGYRRFSLGMAPLAGLDERALAPLWHRAGSLLFRFGEQFYNFQGLRQYKSKFHPAWRARYIAGPSNMSLMRSISDVAALISGGLGGLISK